MMEARHDAGAAGFEHANMPREDSHECMSQHDGIERTEQGQAVVVQADKASIYYLALVKSGMIS